MMPVASFSVGRSDQEMNINKRCAQSHKLSPTFYRKPARAGLLLNEYTIRYLRTLLF